MEGKVPRLAHINCWMNGLLAKPSSLGASVYDHCLAFLTRHPEAIKNARVSNRLPVRNFIPAIKIIGGAVGEIFNGPYAVFTKDEKH